MRTAIKCLAVIFLSVGSAHAGELHSTFPDAIDPDASYLFYSHGFIVEGDDPTPRHPEWGVYDFPAITAALAGSEFHVVAYHRPSGTDPVLYAETLAGQVRELIDAGVAPEKITLAGFSRGGRITVYASHMLAETPVNIVILAACWPWSEEEPGALLSGDVLSIYETSDGVGSCQKLVDRSYDIKSFQEISISTGKGHGAFYSPDPIWLEPLMEWVGSHTKSASR